MLYLPFLPFQPFPLLVSDYRVVKARYTETYYLVLYPCAKVRITPILLPATSTEADNVVDIIDIGVSPFAGQKYCGLI